MKDNSILDTLIEIALKEDLGDAGDITSNFFIDNNSLSSGTIIAKENCVIAGSEIAERVFKRLDPNIAVKVELPSGSIASTGDVIMDIEVVAVLFDLKKRKSLAVPEDFRVKASKLLIDY